ncbi:MAG: hypothetical protein JST54_33435 [Deltaproteobacteria bacterium]|nr:hypothetical protein [Deltaproteobacteria bacterium]
MATQRDVLERGFPVTLRLCELPGYSAFLEAHGAQLSSVERRHLGDWLVVVDAEELEAGAVEGALFDGFLQRTLEELAEDEFEPAMAA